jgi:two-component system sensor histidine kinase/response regulator
MDSEKRGDPSFDPTEALAGVADDRELLGQMVALFCAESPRMLATIKKSIDEQDAAALARAAHALKGSVGNFGKSEAFKVAEALERNALSGALADAAAQYSLLERLISRLERDLNAFSG